MRLQRKNIRLVYDEETQKNLKKFCILNGINVGVDHMGREIKQDDFGFHTTIFYSTTRHGHEIPDGLKIPYKGEVTPLTYKKLGPTKSFLCLVVRGFDINYLRSVYEVMGVDDQYESLLPHITLSYRHQGNTPIYFPDFNLKYDVLKINDINDGIV